jgi:hypothetical protein
MGRAFTPFVANLDVAQWHTIGGYPSGTTDPPQGAPIRITRCATRLPRTSEAIAQGQDIDRQCDLILGFPPGQPTPPLRYWTTWDVTGNVGRGNPDFTLFELPPGSNQWYICLRSIVVARGFVNEHKNCYCSKAFTGVSHENM